MNRFVNMSACVSGFIVGLFIVLSQLTIMEYSKWLTLHNSLIVFSLALCGYIGYKSKSIKDSLIRGGQFTIIFMTLYILSYIISTTWLVENLKWIPFFYKDYNHHGYATVKEYLATNNNYTELLKLQMFSLLISSLIFITTNSIGYISRQIFKTTTH